MKTSRRRLNRALALAALLQTFGVMEQEGLATELKSFVGMKGMFNTESMLNLLKKKIMMDLQHNSRDMLDVPGINTSVADTGSLSGLFSDRERFIEGTYNMLATPINVGGISGGLEVIGKGKLKREFLDVKERVK